MARSHVPPPQTVQADAVDVLLGNSPSVLSANLIASVVVVGGTVGWPRSPSILAWLCAMTALAGARWGLYLRWRRGARPIAPLTWTSWSSLASLVSGALWGSAPWLFIANIQSVQALLVAFVLGGLVAGSAGTLSSHLLAFLAFTLPALAPLVVRFASGGGLVGWLMALMTVVYAVLMTLVANNVRRAILDALALRARNDRLLEEQRQARLELESVNRDLDARVAERTLMLQARAHRERAVADLGIRALSEDGIADLARRASEELRCSLDVDLVGVYELLPDGKTLRSRGAAGTLPESVERLDVSSTPFVTDSPGSASHSELAYSTLRDMAICTDDGAGPEYQRDVLAKGTGVRSYASVALLGEQGPLGLLFVGSSNARIFGRVDGSFIQIVANVLAGAMARHRIETARRASQQLAAMGRLASGVAHEINTPIQFIGHSASFSKTAARDIRLAFEEHVAFVDSLADRPELASKVRQLAALRQSPRLAHALDKLPESLDRIRLGADRVAEIVSALRPLGATRSRSAETDVNQLLRSAEIITNHLTKPVADVHLELAPLPHIVAHPGELLQVLQSLIANAVDAIRARGDVSRGKIVLRSFMQGPTVVIEVEDDGCGIPEQLCSHIFEPFHTTKGPEQGSGQGLAIARDIIDRGHRGRISVWSDVGAGTAIRIEIPNDLESPESWRSVVMTDLAVRRCS
jgi:signal transduction histidine kinase